MGVRVGIDLQRGWGDFGFRDHRRRGESPLFENWSLQ